MTNEHLRPLSDIAFRMAKSSLEKHGTVSVFFVLHTPDGKTEELHVPNECGSMMNSFTAKEILFRMVRVMAEQRGADAVIVVSEMWVGKATDAGVALPEEEFRRLESERGFETGISLGFIERHEVVSVAVHTPDTVLMITQRFRRIGKRITYCGDRDEQQIPQEDWGGAMKMYGEVTPIRPEAEKFLEEYVRSKGTP